VTFSFVLLHHCASRHFFRSAPVAPGALSALFDVLIFTLFFCTYTVQMFFAWHELTFPSFVAVTLAEPPDHGNPLNPLRPQRN
jgi:hypothetical protein